ncbi:MAG: Flp pilus assembly protein CpaB [Planctomycetaceae bacterium]
MPPPLPWKRSRNYPMAIADLEPGTVITAGHLAMGPWPVTESKSTYARSDSILIGRVVKEPIKAARPIDTLTLYAPGDGPKPDLAPGTRAVSIDLQDGAAAVDGLVKAGDYVDVLFSPNVESGADMRGGLTMTMFKGVRVVKLVTANRNMGGGQTITLELTPEQANILLLAARHGTLNMTYTPDGRGDGGVAVADKDRAFFDEILGLAPPKEAEKPFVTEHFRAGGRSVQAFDDEGNVWGSGFDNRGDDVYDGGNSAPYEQNGREPTGGWGTRGFRGVNSNATSRSPGLAQSDMGSAAARRASLANSGSGSRNRVTSAR